MTTTTGRTPTAVHAKRRGNGVKILATLAVLAMAGGIFTVASLALFTDQETVTGNSFTSGTLDLVATPATAVVTAGAMAPGDQVTAELDALNNGTLELRYSATSTTTEDTLASELVLTVKSGVTTCDDANWGTDGTVLYSGVLGTTGTTPLFGNPVQGADAGDRVLAAGANEPLCFNVTLPLAATNAAQGLTSIATFTFDAEQTANNP
jgi:spore coat-associated protein N